MEHLEKKLLFVDDEPNFLNGLRRMLAGQRRAWEMHFVGSVDEALEAMVGQSFDAVVADLHMAEKDGFDLLRALRESDWTTPDD